MRHRNETKDQKINRLRQLITEQKRWIRFLEYLVPELDNREHNFDEVVDEAIYTAKASGDWSYLGYRRKR